VIFGSAASASDISGNVASFGKKLPDLKVTLSRVNATQSAENGVVYDFLPLSIQRRTKTAIMPLTISNNGMYRVNVTYNDITYGENVGLQGKSLVDFNLSEKIEGYVLKANKTLEGYRYAYWMKPGSR